MNSDQFFKLDLPPKLEIYREKLEATVRPSVKITAKLSDEWKPWQSNFFGFPYLPKGDSLPTDATGRQFYLLAQINFEEVPRLPGFPESGILQFFLENEGSYGLNYTNPRIQEGFKLRFFETPTRDLSELQLDFPDYPSPWARNAGEPPCRFAPLWLSQGFEADPNHHFSLEFQVGGHPITFNEFRSKELIGREQFEKLDHLSDEDADALEDLIEDEAEAWSEYRERFGTGHRLGGYPEFTQDDPRKLIDQGEEPYELLLQIDSDHTVSPGNIVEILWGDMGVANFFIRPSALARRDFSDVLYNWDCS